MVGQLARRGKPKELLFEQRGGAEWGGGGGGLDGKRISGGGGGSGRGVNWLLRSIRAVAGSPLCACPYAHTFISSHIFPDASTPSLRSWLQSHVCVRMCANILLTRQ